MVKGVALCWALSRADDDFNSSLDLRKPPPHRAVALMICTGRGASAARKSVGAWKVARDTKTTIQSRELLVPARLCGSHPQAGASDSSCPNLRKRRVSCWLASCRAREAANIMSQPHVAEASAHCWR